MLPTNREVTEPLHGRESAVCRNSREIIHNSISVDAHAFPSSSDTPEQPLARERTEHHLMSATVIQNEDAHMLDFTEQPFMISGQKELPFTYLASLSEEWAAVQENKPSVRGKIKVSVYFPFKFPPV